MIRKFVGIIHEIAQQQCSNIDKKKLLAELGIIFSSIEITYIIIFFSS